MEPKIIVTPPGPIATEIIEKEKKYMPKMAQSTTPMVWKEAKGATVTDVDGNKYIDFTSGILVSNIGHSHPKVVKAIQDQAAKFLNSYDCSHHLRAELVELLASLFPEDLKKVLLLTTGAEAVEAAVKIAKVSTGNNEIISFHGGFHGRTYMTMGLGGQTKIKRGFGPQAANVIHAPFPYAYRNSFCKNDKELSEYCLNYLEEVLYTASTGSVAAVIMEPYLGGGGCVIPPKEFVQGVRRFCDKHNILLIMDEIQAGFGRTGKLFGYQHFDIVPDIICLAKGISSGVPTSAVIARESVYEKIKGGSIASTYGGNPLSCAAAITSIKILFEENLVERAEGLGRFMAERLYYMQEKYDILGEARSIGLVSGLEIVKTPESKEPSYEYAKEIVLHAIQSGLSVIGPSGLYSNVIRLMPPLMINKESLITGLNIFETALAIVNEQAKHETRMRAV